MRVKVSAVLFALLFLCSSCAFDLARIKIEPVDLISDESTDDSFMLVEDVLLDKSPCNYDRTLRAGTQWTAFGVLDQGTVYRSSDQVLTVECSNIFEAYIVVQDAALVGVYLPVDKGYVALKRTYALNIQ